MHYDFEVGRLSRLDLHALRLIACAKQSVIPRRKVKVNYARAIGSFRSDDAFVRRIQNRHLTPGQSGVRFCQFFHELPGYRLHLEFAVLRCVWRIADSGEISNSPHTGCGGSEAVVGREVLRTLLGARRAPAGFSTEKIEHESAAAGRNWDSPVLSVANCRFWQKPLPERSLVNPSLTTKVHFHARNVHIDRAPAGDASKACQAGRVSDGGGRITRGQTPVAHPEAFA